MWFLVLGLVLHATFLLLWFVAIYCMKQAMYILISQYENVMCTLYYSSSIGVSAAANQAEEEQLPLFSHLLPLKPLESTALARSMRARQEIVDIGVYTSPLEIYRVIKSSN